VSISRGPHVQWYLNENLDHVYLHCNIKTMDVKGYSSTKQEWWSSACTKQTLLKCYCTWDQHFIYTFTLQLCEIQNVCRALGYTDHRFHNSTSRSTMSSMVLEDNKYQGTTINGNLRSKCTILYCIFIFVRYVKLDERCQLCIEMMYHTNIYCCLSADNFWCKGSQTFNTLKQIHGSVKSLKTMW